MINKKKLISLIITIAITLAICLVILNIIDWSETWGIIRGVSFKFLILGSLSILVSIIIRSFRWWKISGSPQNELILFIKATSVGYMGNFLIPFRAGELVRIWIVYKIGNKNPVNVALKSISDRATDFLIISGIMVVIIPFIQISEKLNPIKFFSIFIFSIIIILIIICYFFKEKLKKLLNSYKNTDRKLILFFSKIIQSLIEILETISKSPLKFFIIFLFVGLFDMLSIWFVMLSLGWSLPFISVPLFLVVMSFASVLPAAPGYIGLYQVSAILTFSLYEIGINDAFAYSILLQGITAFSYLIFGFFALLLLFPDIIKKFRNM